MVGKNKCLALICLLFTAAQAGAQAPSPLLSAAGQARDLEFPSEPSGIVVPATPRMALYKPEGAGPFPALVLHHQCGGLGGGGRPNASMLDWTKEALARGYVALLVDSLGPRGVKTVCMGPQGGVILARGVRDALQAAEHLRKFEFVDRRRIALVGYSWGAMVGVLASSRRWGTALAPGGRFEAVVSFYPGCFTLRPPSGNPYEIVNADIDRPLLVLMGGKDTETPAGECIAKLDAAKSAGAPVEWHVYPQATHCWDCRQLDGWSKIDSRGSQVTYRYDKEVTQDAARRTFEFLDKALRTRP